MLRLAISMLIAYDADLSSVYGIYVVNYARPAVIWNYVYPFSAKGKEKIPYNTYKRYEGKIV